MTRITPISTIQLLSLLSALSAVHGRDVLDGYVHRNCGGTGSFRELLKRVIKQLNREEAGTANRR